jgi:hypothetical protein
VSVAFESHEVILHERALRCTLRDGSGNAAISLPPRESLAYNLSEDLLFLNVRGKGLWLTRVAAIQFVLMDD